MYQNLDKMNWAEQKFGGKFDNPFFPVKIYITFEGVWNKICSSILNLFFFNELFFHCFNPKIY